MIWLWHSNVTVSKASYATRGVCGGLVSVKQLARLGDLFITDLGGSAVSGKPCSVITCRYYNVAATLRR